MTTEYFLNATSHTADDRLLVYRDQRLMVRGDRFTWSRDELLAAIDPGHPSLLIASEQGTRYFAVFAQGDTRLRDVEYVPLRQRLIEGSSEEFRITGLGSQLLTWYLNHRYCGACGGPTRPHDRERALVCERCALSFYPRINPCVIVLVRRGDQVLLARHARYRAAFYSCLAGFVEAGETPEQTVIREVREEAGIEVSNIRYYKSQSWPFPSQLMLGFFADFAAGELQPDEEEIEDLRWFSPADLPAEIPTARISVAGELIQRYLDEVAGRVAARNEADSA